VSTETILSPLPVAVDAMGGDHGPSVVVEGAVAAAREWGIRSILVGRNDELGAILSQLGASAEQLISVQHASEVISMDDSPSVAIRGKLDASVRVAFQLVKDGKACAVVSPGNTGAMMAAGIAVCGILPGVFRPAISSLIPRPGALKPLVLLDSGANVDCNAQQLVQFALMGKYYAITALGVGNPRVALLSNGSEPSKGTDVIRAAGRTLSEMPELNFVGYVEGRDLPRDSADVVVCDGFVGNVVLKAMEGTVELVFDSLRAHVKGNLRGKVGMWLAKPLFKSLFREKLDPSAYGGAPLLGLSQVGIVCHGSANSRAIKNAVRAAHRFATEGLVPKIADALTELEGGAVSGVQDGIWDRMGQRFERRKRARTQTTDPVSSAGDREERK
jgi:glycerol-3-phosphate acyltransferase PlsX